MGGWAIVAIIAIIVWGVVQISKANRGIVTDKQGNESFRPADDDGAAQREIEELRERIKVLERIATDNNSLDAREKRRIAREIESLRDDAEEAKKD